MKLDSRNKQQKWVRDMGIDCSSLFPYRASLPSCVTQGQWVRDMGIDCISLFPCRASLPSAVLWGTLWLGKEHCRRVFTGGCCACGAEGVVSVTVRSFAGCCLLGCCCCAVLTLCCAHTCSVLLCPRCTHGAVGPALAVAPQRRLLSDPSS